MTKIEKILDIDPGRELSEPVHLVSVQKSDVGQGSAVSARWWCVWNIHVCLPISCCVTDIRCAAVCRRNSAELLGCEESGKQRWATSYTVIPRIRLRCYVSVTVRYSVYTSTLFRVRRCTLFRIYVYVVPFPSLYVIPFIRVRCSVSVNVCYSVYTCTLFRFCQCTLFRLYVYVVPFPSMYVIPHIRLYNIHRRTRNNVDV